MHECPGRCGRSVPTNKYACGQCWNRLPFEHRHAITTAWEQPGALRRLPSPAHREAMRQAGKWLRENPL